MKSTEWSEQFMGFATIYGCTDNGRLFTLISGEYDEDKSREENIEIAKKLEILRELKK
jgi:hypothetical protein